MLFEEQIRKEYPFKHWIIAVTKFIHLITNIFLNIFHDYINKKNGISLFLLRKLINRINWKIESKTRRTKIEPIPFRDWSRHAPQCKNCQTYYWHRMQSISSMYTAVLLTLAILLLKQKHSLSTGILVSASFLLLHNGDQTCVWGEAEWVSASSHAW